MEQPKDRLRLRYRVARKQLALVEETPELTLEELGALLRVRADVRSFLQLSIPLSIGSTPAERTHSVALSSAVPVTGPEAQRGCRLGSKAD